VSKQSTAGGGKGGWVSNAATHSRATIGLRDCFFYVKRRTFPFTGEGSVRDF